MARVTVFGAGAMGTAMAIHLARRDEDVALWGSAFDERALISLADSRAHPALSEALPEGVPVLGPDELETAAKGVEVAVVAANSDGARSLATLIADALADGVVVVSIAKGLEPGTRTRITEVYREVLVRASAFVAVGGPSLAPEVAEGMPTLAVFAAADADALGRTAAAFGTDAYRIEATDDIEGVELCGTIKNVGAIGAGILEGLGAERERDYKNARAGLFARAVSEMADLVEALGGRRETALGLAGVGDLLVTSIGGRNRTYGETVGAGAEPSRTLEDMKRRGLTVEGAESARDVHELAEAAGLHLPIHGSIYRIVHEGAPPGSILEALR